jgi:hypothetical protein
MMLPVAATAYTHRFHATRKPGNSPKPARAQRYKPPSSGIRRLICTTTAASGK